MRRRQKQAGAQVTGALVGVALATACVPSPQDADGTDSITVPEWTVYSTTVASIGVIVGEDPYQLHDVRHAIRLADGRIVVANSGSGEVRFFDARGAFLFSSGGKGQGPGEYRTVDVLFAAGGDTLIVTDHAGYGEERTSAVSTSTGDFLGLLPTPEDAFPYDEWPHGDLIVGSPVRPHERGAVAAAVDRLPPLGANQERGFVRVTREGLVWATSSPRTARGTPTPWEIFDLKGNPVARTSTPTGVHVLDMGSDWVLGMWKDTLGVHHVGTFGVERPAWNGPDLASEVAASSDPAPVFHRVPGPYTEPLGRAIRDFAIAQEFYYAERRSYAHTIDELGEVDGSSSLEVPRGISLDYFARGPDFWMIRGEDAAAGLACLMVYGSPGLVGVPRGQIRCWRSGTQ